jgi:hypothetical protein
MHSHSLVWNKRRTFSTLTRFWRTFSTLTIESFHDYGRLFYPLTLILFHDYKRSHMCAVYCNRGINVNSSNYSGPQATGKG